MNSKKVLAEHIAFELGVSSSEVLDLIEVPKHDNLGDLAFPCFTLAQKLKQSPEEIAKNLTEKVQHPLFEKVEAKGPFFNVFLNKKMVSQEVLKTVLGEGNNYGSSQEGIGQNVVLDFSSPNIAKPFSMGHLRSTVIGQSLANIVEKMGYQSVKINYLGDHGTQFGKLIYAYLLWGDEEKVKANPIKELLHLYVRFHEEAEDDSSLDDEGRAWFKKLEDGDSEAVKLWKWFREESLKEFSKIYDLLGVEFDSYNGEAFYNDKMTKAIDLLKENGLLTTSEGAEVVDLSDYELPPSLIQKQDGATLYATRDLTAAIHRQEAYEFDQAIYVVGHEQSLHFNQLFIVLEKMGYQWAKHMHHVPFGFILKNGKKMSTRKGEVVLLEVVIQEAIELAKQNIDEKSPYLEDKDEVAKMVGVGAIIFHDLKNERLNNIEFSLGEMLRFEGNTGPYIQYTYARACSIIRKAERAIGSNVAGLDDPYSWPIVKQLESFPNVIYISFREYEPSVIAKYLIDLAQSFNKYYGQVKILEADEMIDYRLALVKAVSIVIKEGLRLLGIQAPEKM
ncbi:arginine--tRNA ligase [Tenuibacillus multivorans]|uniref:Arginine--tRNA ligase n=1 Tax=Tenuibacillus multivorans TaxID=237069 RepID=A0A1H0DSZ7_9BACI|nr:arginine--tRNA ligase [Tenuibacillus multivorans]GEL78824.1 arginine--tRNA ligase 1 [Tenuibacillus multivorans]SDN73101.1 arginyl-tRNA synthetase [Tenuibacillus multivorans]